MLESFTPPTPEQIAFYQENGYLQVHNFFTPQEVEHIKSTMLRTIAEHQEQVQTTAEISLSRCEPGDEAGRKAAMTYLKVFAQRVNLWKFDAEMKAIAWNPNVAEFARQIAGFQGLRLWHDQALIKPGGDSRASNWHQDTVYWPMNENGGFSIWIALDDVDDNNGCMWFVPKSRDLGRMPYQNLSSDDPQALLKLPELEGKLAEPVCMAMQAGGVTFHDGLTFHYANANHTDKPRHVFVMLYMQDGVTFNGTNHLCTDDKGLAAGDPIAGDEFPLLAGGPMASH